MLSSVRLGSRKRAEAFLLSTSRVRLSESRCMRDSVRQVGQVHPPAEITEVEDRQAAQVQPGFPGRQPSLFHPVVALNRDAGEEDRDHGDQAQKRHLRPGDLLVALLPVVPAVDDRGHHAAEVEDQEDAVEDFREDASIDDLSDDAEDYPAGHGVRHDDLDQAALFQLFEGAHGTSSACACYGGSGRPYP
jgi:hypothetical protein